MSENNEKIPAFIVIDLKGQRIDGSYHVFVTSRIEFAHDHINDAILNGVEGAEFWVVRKYIEADEK